jgi:glutamine cyclotransferase
MAVALGAEGAYMRHLGKTPLILLAAAVVVAGVYFILRGYGPGGKAPSKSAPTYAYRIVNTYPHDPDAFTQGLAFEDGILYEGTGRRGRSSLRKVDLESGQVLKIHELPDSLFGEGITVYEDRIMQLTYTSQIGFVYDKASFDISRQFTYPTRGWGLTHDGSRLIMSDGTSMLYFLDPESFARIGHIIVKEGRAPVIGLNELEYIKGEIYANVWQTDRIVRIAPRTGEVTGWIDLADLLSPEARTDSTGVLNGIAYDIGGDRLFVTGKFWPRLFEIELIRQR